MNNPKYDKMKSIINTSELAQRLGVTQPAISAAKRRGNKVKGIDLTQIAIADESGKNIGFDSIKLQKLLDSLHVEPRPNPAPEPEYRQNPRDNSSIVGKAADALPSLLGLPPRLSIPIFGCGTALAGGVLMYYATERRPDVQPWAVAAGCLIGGITYGGSVALANWFYPEDSNSDLSDRTQQARAFSHSRFAELEDKRNESLAKVFNLSNSTQTKTS